MSSFSHARLTPLFDPRSVAVVGASTNPVRIGGRVAKYIVDGGWDGHLMPVNPNASEVMGLPCYASIADLPEAPDLAVLAVSASQTIDTVRQLAERGGKSAITFAAGFREAGPEGAALERELAAVVEETGIVLMGPNSAGFRNTHTALSPTFTTDIGLGLLPGSVAVVSQSGGLGGYFGSTVLKKRGIGHKWIVGTGNELDVELADVIAYLAHDPDVSVIGVITEGFKDGDRIQEAFALANELHKPVVAWKIGTSVAGASAAYSHTGALAGTDGVYDAVFRQHNVYRAEDERDFTEILGLYDARTAARGRRVAVFSLSGGIATTLVDTCEERGLELPAIEPPSDPELVKLLPAGRFENPLDLTGQIGAEPQLLGAVLDHVASLPQVDMVVLGFAYMMQSQRLADVFAPAVIAAKQASGTPMAVVGLMTEAAEAQLREAEIVVETYPTDAVNALAGLTDHLAGPGSPSSPVHESAAASADAGPRGSVLTGPEAAAQLPGIPFVTSTVVHSAEEASASAAEIGGPVVLKGEAPALMHKTELGLVRVGVEGDAAVAQAYREVAAIVEPLGGDVHVQPLVDGVEVVLGVQNDPTFGPVIMVGLGGIFVEILKDVAFGVPPLDEATARAMVTSLRGYPLLTGARGSEPAAVEDVVAALVRLSEICSEGDGVIEELDINPFLVGTRPGSSVAVDAVLVRSGQLSEAASAALPAA